MSRIFLLAIVMLAASACRKTGFITSPDAEIRFSRDTIFFDTVFTEQASVTRFFKIFNPNDQKLRISSIRLQGGPSSPFSLVADGIEGPLVEQIEMEPGDSIFVFVNVTVDPSDQSLPFLVEDSIAVRLNGIERQVQLRAYGQQAAFFRNADIVSDTTWTAGLPIVITGGLRIHPQATLRISEGARIYLHADAPLHVEGRILAIGGYTDSSRILFQGDRIDAYYKDLPGSWPGIYFHPGSTENRMEGVTIRNAYQGIVVDGGGGFPAFDQLRLARVILDNCYETGLLALRARLYLENCLLSNCGKNLQILGGWVTARHCSIVAISNSYVPHRNPGLTLTNFLVEDNQLQVYPLQMQFTNCMIWGEGGTADDEVQLLLRDELPSQVLFEHCLWNQRSPLTGAMLSGMIEPENPMFADIRPGPRIFDFHLLAGSPAIAAGTPTPVTEDLDGQPRDPMQPDLGAYEFIP